VEGFFYVGISFQKKKLKTKQKLGLLRSYGLESMLVTNLKQSLMSVINFLSSNIMKDLFWLKGRLGVKYFLISSIC
jgi:hypothetical protein